MRKTAAAPAPHEVPASVSPECLIRRDTPVEQAAAVLNLEPTVVQANTPLNEVSSRLQAHPNVHVVCVVAADGRLIGLISMQNLADALFMHVLPEEYLSRIHELEDVMQFADRSRMRTAADVMQAPQWVKAGETVKDAFKRMHEFGLSGLPVVDDLYHVVGFINMLELLAICFDGLTATGVVPGGETR